MAGIKKGKVSEEILLELQNIMSDRKAIGKLQNPDDILSNLYFLDNLDLNEILEPKEITQPDIKALIYGYCLDLHSLKYPIPESEFLPIKQGIKAIAKLREFYENSVFDCFEYSPDTPLIKIDKEISKLTDPKFIFIDREEVLMPKKEKIHTFGRLINILENDFKQMTERKTLSQINANFDDRLFDTILAYSQKTPSKTQLLKDIQALRVSIKRNFIPLKDK